MLIVFFITCVVTLFYSMLSINNIPNFCYFGAIQILKLEPEKYFLNDSTQELYVSSKGPLSGISRGLGDKQELNILSEGNLLGNRGPLLGTSNSCLSPR